MIFNFIDTITNFESRQSATGIKLISEAQRPYMIGDKLYPMMLLEAIGQLNAWITMEMNNFQVRPLAILYGEINIYDTASLGDNIIIETELTRYDDTTSLFNGRVKRGKKILLEVFDAAGSFLDINDFAYPAEYVSMFAKLKESRLSDNAKPNFDANFSSASDIKNLFHHDKLIALDENEIQATKQIKKNYPFFKEHFPKKPILPISILLQNNIELGKKLPTQLKGHEFRMTKISLSKIKMRDFIQPGADLYTTIKPIDNHADDNVITCSFNNKIANKSVCRGQIQYFCKD